MKDLPSVFALRWLRVTWALPPLDHLVLVIGLHDHTNMYTSSLFCLHIGISWIYCTKSIYIPVLCFVLKIITLTKKHQKTKKPQQTSPCIYCSNPVGLCDLTSVAAGTRPCLWTLSRSKDPRLMLLDAPRCGVKPQGLGGPAVPPWNGSSSLEKSHFWRVKRCEGVPISRALGDDFGGFAFFALVHNFFNLRFF